MNTKKLQSHYYKLTAEERLRLVFAAEQRGDEKERAALMNSAPTLPFSVKHHFGLGMALREVADSLSFALLLRATEILFLMHYDEDRCGGDLADDRVDAERMAKIMAYVGGDYLATLEASGVIAEEYGISENDLLIHSRQRFPFLGQALDAVGTLAKIWTDPTNVRDAVGDLINYLRQEIAERRKEWEGGGPGRQKYEAQRAAEFTERVERAVVIDAAVDVPDVAQPEDVFPDKSAGAADTPIDEPQFEDVSPIEDAAADDLSVDVSQLETDTLGDDAGAIETPPSPPGPPSTPEPPSPPEPQGIPPERRPKPLTIRGGGLRPAGRASGPWRR